MKRLYLFLIVTLSSIVGMSQVSITTLNTPYSQNFDELASTGTSSVTPQGWLFSKSNGNTTYAADNGTANAGNTYSFGATGSTERAFGTIISNTVTSTIGAFFSNNSGSTITSITLNYYGERWRLGTASRVDSLIFQYSTNATSLTSGTYTTVNELSYGAPAIAGTVGPLDGNATANRTAISYTITGLSIPANSTFYFRWNDYNAALADDGLGIDDVTINFNGNTLPPCTAPTAQPSALTFNTVTTTSFNVSFTAASPVADEYLSVISTFSSLSAVPVNGTTYNTDDAVGNGIVAYRGSATTFSETNLTPGTTYYLYIFALSSNCSGGPLYLTANPVTGSQATTAPPVCTAPAAPVTNVVFSSITGNSINGSFSAVADADGYLVIRSTNSTLGFAPTNGTAYPVGSTAGNGTVVKYGSGNTFSATGLATSTTYYFTFYALNGFNCTSGPVYNTTALSASTATNNNTSGIPAGYYDTVTTQTCSPLKSALKWRTYPSLTPKTYGDLWTQYLVSDVKPREVGITTGASPNVIWDIYSDNPTGNDPYNFTPGPVANGGQQDNGTNTSTEGVYYNREHSVPLSWFKGSTTNPGPATDYNHIFPTDKVVNAQRSNYIYGEVTSPTFTSLNGSKLGPNAFAGLTGIAFEPINEYKGDVARAFLYFITRYQDSMAIFLTNNTSEGQQAFEPNIYPSADTPYLRLMLKWHAQDPVSQKEIDRNNAAYTYQGNRNPFIDHPEYVERIWGANCIATLPVHLVSFKGTLRGSEVVLNWEAKNEDNLQRYEIERSDNNRVYTLVGKVNAANQSQYQFADDISSLTGRRLYYRLRKVDKDGSYTYSDVFSTHIPLRLSFSVYPNPVSDGTVRVQFAKPVSASAFLQLTDVAGKLIQQVPITEGMTNCSFVTKPLAKGLYLLRLVQPGSNTAVQKIQVQ